MNFAAVVWDPNVQGCSLYYEIHYLRGYWVAVLLILAVGVVSCYLLLRKRGLGRRTASLLLAALVPAFIGLALYDVTSVPDGCDSRALEFSLDPTLLPLVPAVLILLLLAVWRPFRRTQNEQAAAPPSSVLDA